MTGRDWRAETVAALAELGDTPDAVAAALTAAGCTGRRLASRACPLFRWLQRRGLPVRDAGEYAVNLIGSYHEIPVPSAVRRFVGRFDAGMYRELDEAVAA